MAFVYFLKEPRTGTEVRRLAPNHRLSVKHSTIVAVSTRGEAPEPSRR